MVTREIIIPDETLDKYNIEPISTRPRYAHVLFSGDSGVGKTAIIGTASRHVKINKKLHGETSNLLYLSFDNRGSDTFIDMGVECDIITPTHFENNAGKNIGIMPVLSWLNNNKTPYDVLALDSYNQMQDLIAREIIGESTTRATSNNRTTTHKEGLELADYGILKSRCNRINDLLFSLNKHIIVTSLVTSKVDPLDIVHKERKDKNLIYSLALDGSTAYTLPSQFSLHGIMKRTGSGQNLNVTTYFRLGDTTSKTRFRTESSIENLTFPKLLKEMNLLKDHWDIDWIRDEKGFLPKLKV